MTQHLQVLFYHFILTDTFVAEKIDPSFFEEKRIELCFKYAKDYLIKYHEAPSTDQIKEIIRLDDKTEIIPNDFVDILYSAKSSLAQYTNDWLYEQVTAWAEWNALISSTKNMLTYIKMNQSNVSSENVKEIIEHAKSNFNKTCLLDFNDVGGTGSDFFDAESHKQTILNRTSTGYPYLDKVLDGGYFEGNLICLVGAPKVGKSLWLQNLCAKAILRGDNSLYITLELPEPMIHMRMGSNLFGISTLEYSKVSADSGLMKEKIQAFKNSCAISPGKFFVKSFPTSTCSTMDLEAYILNKEEEISLQQGTPFKFKNIFVDYINIMRNWRNPNTENTYMKIKQIAEDLKAIALKNHWSVITATQTNRSQFGTSDITENQVSESSALNATVDLLMGIIQDPMMRAQNYYYLKCMLDRVANEANTKKRFIVNWDYMRIDEDTEAVIESTVDCSPTSQISKKTTFYKEIKSEPKPKEDSNNSNNLYNGTIDPNVNNPVLGSILNITGADLY